MHGHHVGLLSVMNSKESRIEEIRANKPQSQQELRLKLLQIVPLRLLPEKVVIAAKEWDKVDKAWDKVDKARVKAYKTWDKVDKALGKAYKRWDKVDKARVKAWDDFQTACKVHKVSLEALHKQLCVPDCPWDGTRILPD